MTIPFHARQGASPLSPWILLGAAALLFVILMILTAQNVSRERSHMSRVLSEKGAALIRSFEAGARTGMMQMQWSGRKIQRLLEETARQEDILYLAVANGQGRILAHSDPGLIGKRADLGGVAPRPDEQWRITTSPMGVRAFEVYRYFRPLGGFGPGHRRQWQDLCQAPPSADRENAWCYPAGPGESEKVIFVGLDVEPFASAQKEDIRRTVFLSLVLMLIGVAGLISLFWAYNYKIARQSLEDTSAFASEVVSHLPVGLIATGPDDTIAHFNTAAERITGLGRESAMGKRLEVILDGLWCDLQSSLTEGGPVLERETECIFRGHSPVPLSISAARISGADGRFAGNILILRDLGEVRRLEEAIRRQEKLAAIGSLAAGIAHEIRNPLSSIKGLAAYFSEKFAPGSEDRETAAFMGREVDRLNRVIGELLEFARPADLKPRPMDIAATVEHSLQLARQDAQTRNIRVKWSSEGELPPVAIDPDRMAQCLLNLYLNAIQAMDPGGELLVSAASADGGGVRLEVADTGKGINPQDLAKIFNPYFTTKSTGTGLGLAIVHKIVEAHGARIKVRSMPGRGTVFSIIFPGMAGDTDETDTLKPGNVAS